MIQKGKIITNLLIINVLTYTIAIGIKLWLLQ